MFPTIIKTFNKINQHEFEEKAWEAFKAFFFFSIEHASFFFHEAAGKSLINHRLMEK